jgi:hypothetical protein
MRRAVEQRLGRTSYKADDRVRLANLDPRAVLAQPTKIMDTARPPAIVPAEIQQMQICSIELSTTPSP